MTGQQYTEILELLKERVAEFRQTTDKDAKANLKEGVEQLVSTLLADTIAALGVRSAHLRFYDSEYETVIETIPNPAMGRSFERESHVALEPTFRASIKAYKETL